MRRCGFVAGLAEREIWYKSAQGTVSRSIAVARKLLLPAILLATVVVWIEYYRYTVGDRELTKGQLETRLRRQHQLTDLSLTEHQPGQFTGSGTTAEGVAFRVAIKQDHRSRQTFAVWFNRERGIADDEEHSIEFADFCPLYIILGTIYVLWAALVAGKSIRSHRQASGS